jgi:hypothetical protein
MCCKTVFLTQIIGVKNKDTCIAALLILFRFRHRGCSFSHLTDCQPNVPVSFIRLCKGHYQCDPLYGCRHRLSNLPDTLRRKQRWRSDGLAFIGQAGKETPYIMIEEFRTKSTTLKNKI